MARKDYEKLLKEAFNGEKRIEGYEELPGPGTVTFTLRMPIDGFFFQADFNDILEIFGAQARWVEQTSFADRPAGKVYHFPPKKDVCHKYTFYDVVFEGREDGD